MVIDQLWAGELRQPSHVSLLIRTEVIPHLVPSGMQMRRSSSPQHPLISLCTSVSTEYLTLPALPHSLNSPFPSTCKSPLPSVPLFLHFVFLFYFFLRVFEVFPDPTATYGGRERASESLRQGNGEGTHCMISQELWGVECCRVAGGKDWEIWQIFL